MSNESIEQTTEDIHQLSEAEPTLWDLKVAQGLWKKIQRFWTTLNREVDKRIRGRELIRVLDFDIIYPAFWSAEMHRPSLLEEHLGFPMTAEFVFKHTRTPFTIPPGAVFELARYLAKLEDEYNIASNKLKRMVKDIELLVRQLPNRGKQATDAKQSIKRGTHEQHIIESNILDKIAPETEAEIEHLISTGLRLNGLNRILKHTQYRHWGEVASSFGARVDYSELVKYRDWFDRERQNKTLNNYIDALNVASYSTLLKSQPIDDTVIAFFPLLASSTPMILELRLHPTESIQDSEYTLDEEAISPVTTQYLSFATAVEAFAGYKPARLLTLGETGLELAQDLDRLSNRFWFDWMSRAYSHTHQGSPEKLGTPAQLKETPLSSVASMGAFREFSNTYVRWRSHFNDAVGNTFIDVARTDRQLRENFHATKRYLLEQFAQGRGLTKAAESSKTSIDFDWVWSAATIDSSLIIQRKHLSPATRDLEALRKAKIIKEESVPFLNPNPTLCTVVTLPDIGETLFRWERTVGSPTQICSWSHRLPAEELLAQIRIFFRSVFADTRLPTSIRLNVYADNAYIKTKVSMDADTAEWHETLLSAAPNPEYVRADGVFCSIFFDLIPAGEANNLEMAVLYEKPRHHKFLSTLHQMTASVPLASSVIEDLLTEYAATFENKEPWITKLADTRKGT